MDKFTYQGKTFSRKDLAAEAKKYSTRIEWSEASPETYSAALMAPAERGQKKLDTNFFDRCVRHMRTRRVVFEL